MLGLAGRTRGAGMAVEVIEGTVEPIHDPRPGKKYGRLDRFRIVTTAGGAREFPRIAIAQPVRGEVAKGGAGRYYVFKGGDGAVGLVGVRRADGTEIYGHFMNVEPVILVVGVLGTLCTIGRFVFGITDLPVLASILGPFLLVAYAYMRRQRISAKQVFDADGAPEAA